MINVFDFQEDKRYNEKVLNLRNLDDFDKLKGEHMIKRNDPKENAIS